MAWCRCLALLALLAMATQVSAQATNSSAQQEWNYNFVAEW